MLSRGGNIGWHQDRGYWRCIDRDEALTVWVALDDVDGENGCTEVVAGSHKWGLLGEDHFYRQDIEIQTKAIEQNTGQLFRTTPCILKAGCVSFHHCYTLHSSRHNASDRPRFSIAIHLIPDGRRYVAGTFSEDHTSNTLLQPRDGDFYGGPYFPVVYREGQPNANVWLTPND